MITFKEYVAQINERVILKHLTHAEDSIIDLGVNGASEVINVLQKTIDNLSGNVNDNTLLQLKIDGAPSLIAGVDPSNKRFFVGTKSLFNKKPKINYSNEDIDNNHKGELAEKLKYALKYLPKAFPKEGIFQGDLMFTENDLKESTIDGNKYITFTPNTITYAVPSNSKLAKKIKNKKIAIALHTHYKGSSIMNMSAEFGIDLSQFKNTSDAWVFSTDIKEHHVLFTKDESNELKSELQELKMDLKKFNKNDMNILKEFKMEIMAFLNSVVRDGRKIDDNSVKDFMNYLLSKEQKTLMKYKTEKGRQNAEQKFDNMKKQIRKAGGTLYYVLLWNKNVGNIKDKILKKIDEMNTFNTFVKKGNDYVPTSPEGIVAVDRLSSNAIKLVDRLSFSKLNFENSKF